MIFVWFIIYILQIHMSFMDNYKLKKLYAENTTGILNLFEAPRSKR